MCRHSLCSQANGASLVGVNSQAEHQFLSGWLMSNDMSRYVSDMSKDK